VCSRLAHKDREMGEARGKVSLCSDPLDETLKLYGMNCCAFLLMSTTIPHRITMDYYVLRCSPLTLLASSPVPRYRLCSAMYCRTRLTSSDYEHQGLVSLLGTYTTNIDLWNYCLALLRETDQPFGYFSLHFLLIHFHLSSSIDN